MHTFIIPQYEPVGKRGNGHLRRWSGRSSALDRAGEPAMESKTTAGLQSPARPAVSTQNTRVTARIVREDDGTIRKEYRVSGRVYASLEELSSALSPESTHAKPPSGEPYVVNECRNDA